MEVRGWGRREDGKEWGDAGKPCEQASHVRASATDRQQLTAQSCLIEKSCKNTRPRSCPGRWQVCELAFTSMPPPLHTHAQKHASATAHASAKACLGHRTRMRALDATRHSQVVTVTKLRMQPVTSRFYFIIIISSLLSKRHGRSSLQAWQKVPLLSVLPGPLPQPPSWASSLPASPPAAPGSSVLLLTPAQIQPASLLQTVMTIAGTCIPANAQVIISLAPTSPLL